MTSPHVSVPERRVGTLRERTADRGHVRAAVDYPVPHDGAGISASGVVNRLLTDTTNADARRTEQVITAMLERPTILGIRVIHTTSAGVATDIYVALSVLERAHDRMHTTQGAHEADSETPIGFEPAQADNNSRTQRVYGSQDNNSSSLMVIAIL